MEAKKIEYSNAKVITAILIGYALAIAWVVYADIVYNNNVPIDAIQFHGLYPLSLGLGAIITALIFDKNLRSLSLNKFKPKYLLLIILIVAVVLVISFLLNLIINVTEINPDPKFDKELIIIGLPVLIILAFGEEIMWRGLLFTELSRKFNFMKTSLIIGILWALWHYPVIIHTKFVYADKPLYFVLPAFTLIVIASSFVYNYIRTISGSVWPCIILHALMNYIAFILIEPYEKGLGANAYMFVNDIGLFYIILYLGVAVWATRQLK